MERIVNMLMLSPEQREAFSDLLAEHEQLFAPDGLLPATGEPLPREVYQRATIDRKSVV
mgnify:CR=1 FL=1